MPDPRPGLSPLRRRHARSRTAALVGDRAGRHRARVLASARSSALLLVAWVPFLVRAVQIYVAANSSRRRSSAPTPQMFREFLDQQGIFVFFVTHHVGAGLIADDRRANALQIYLSKPLTRVEYIAGKLAIAGRCSWRSSLAAGDAAAAAADRVCRQLDVPAAATCS